MHTLKNVSLIQSKVINRPSSPDVIASYNNLGCAIWGVIVPVYCKVRSQIKLYGKVIVCVMCKQGVIMPGNRHAAMASIVTPGLILALMPCPSKVSHWLKDFPMEVPLEKWKDETPSLGK